MLWRRVLLVVLIPYCAHCDQLFGDDEHRRELLSHLTSSEKLFLFGTDESNAQFEIAHLKHAKRRKRSLQGTEDLAALKEHLGIKVNPRNNFLDPQFLLMKRWLNGTELLGHEHEEDCYYRSEHAALYVCDDVRGIIKSKDNYYSIHPLPERFHTEDTKPHVIIKQSNDIESTNEQKCAEHFSQTNISSIEPVKIWSKHRRKRDVNKLNLEEFKGKIVNNNKTIAKFAARVAKDVSRQKRALLPAIFVETAVFVDRDLYKHMTVNFPQDTERELVRFVLAMINAVQLIYHDPSLGRPVNYILKRLEILHEDPANLKRPHDIDRFLSNFCTWQRLENPPGDTDPLHWDHALILTGLDLYVVNKNGKVSSQVVGLAPVAGMCTVTSSCTVNEGRHFESVYVVAHEIGHNLGMRHDGPLADNGCDPSAYIMSPTLGSGKITWSQCSRNYLQKFLDTTQSRCLLDHGSSAGQLDHSAEGILPGERFDADQQCMLKYGRGSRHSATQSLEAVCRDLHCQRERYTWTSHPALEGTKCGDDMYCRGGACVERGGLARWGRWGWAECASACLLTDSLSPAAAGVRVATRRCTRPRHDNGESFCQGPDKKYQSCHAHQCNNVPRMTVREFADQICSRAREVDPDLIGTGLQRMDVDDVSSACAVWCDRRGGGYKSRGWALPDGTACSTHEPMFCISGVCRKFTCSSGEDAEYLLSQEDCEWEGLKVHTVAPPNSIPVGGKASPRRRAAGEWVSASGCHARCVRAAAGLRLVTSRLTHRTNIQLCTPERPQACSQMMTPYQYATMVCSKYKERVRRLSGLGMQISPALEEPDRPCRVACQDERVAHRFYLVNGAPGWFPLGTSCGGNASYCVSGKCLEFGADNTPVAESVFTLPLLERRSSRHRRSSDGTRQERSSDGTRQERSSNRHSMRQERNSKRRRSKRYRRSLQRHPLRVTATLDRLGLEQIITQLNLTGIEEHVYLQQIPDHIELDFHNPVHISPGDTLTHKPHRHTWD